MNHFIQRITKYVVLLIISAIFGIPWFYFRHSILPFGSFDRVIDAIPSFVDYLIRLVIIVLLIVDFKKENLKNIVLTCISALFLPILGILLFSILLIEKEKASA